ncbi:MAG: DUF1275 domain-containing protein [Acidobacteria bacterium]|nr:MAG: DUF1275 domain-containing protein [Acidobacteriota bacterium]
MSSERERALVPVLLSLTAVTGLVDAASVLGLGRVFTANMTGNVVFLGFAAAGAPELSLVRSGAALLAFFVGAAIGGRIGAPIGAGSVERPTSAALGLEAALLLAATGVAFGAGSDLSVVPTRLYAVIGLTGLAMGIRNAVVRKLAVPDLTTTVLTMTITGLAADSPAAGGDGPRWSRRVASVAIMFAGAAAGAWLVARSVAHALAIAGVVSTLAALSARRRLCRAERTVAPH